MTRHTPTTLRAFEARIAAAFNAGEIPHPVHLSQDNEAQLLRYFAQHHRPGDWVFGSWRAHYHALLAGVPEDKLFAAVLNGRSIALNFPAYRVHCSAIVAGQVPLALGVALGIRRWTENLENCKSCKGSGFSGYGTGYDAVCSECGGQSANVRQNEEHVHCFVGDMCAETGTFHEATKYARNHALPITFIVEDNAISVCTQTREVWGSSLESSSSDDSRGLYLKEGNVLRYSYRNPWPHSGAAQRTSF